MSPLARKLYAEERATRLRIAAQREALIARIHAVTLRRAEDRSVIAQHAADATGRHFGRAFALREEAYDSEQAERIVDRIELLRVAS